MGPWGGRKNSSVRERLRGADYLAGPYSFADIAFYMAQLFGARMGAGMSEDTPNLLGWRDRVGDRPAVRAVVGRMAKYLLSEGRPLPDFMKPFASS